MAEKLDAVYLTGGAVSALLHAKHDGAVDGYPTNDVLVVQLSQGGASVPVSRREILAGLGIGALGGLLNERLDRLVATVDPVEDSLRSFERAFAGFQAAARMLPPTRLLDPMIGHVVLMDVLRRRATGRERKQLTVIQSRFAESLSWLGEEAGDPISASYWTDRAAQWATSVNWTAMVAYTFVRRSMMAISLAGDGFRAVDNAGQVLEMHGAPLRVKGLAAKQAAFGHALIGDAEASARALDEAMRLLDSGARDDEIALGQRSVVSDDLYLIFRVTCDIYLGRGDRVVPLLESRLPGLEEVSARTATITRAKLARAYANIGQPQEAAVVAWQALDAMKAIGSASAHGELRRTVPLLRRWEKRSEVRDVLHRLRSTPATA
ncbi:hypothetical protein A6A25_14155 [Saccharothrix sp. CB00851]|nr:hypothetical protein A6A25_14155 [Saccharothrix sp. CB00851]